MHDFCRVELSRLEKGSPIIGDKQIFAILLHGENNQSLKLSTAFVNSEEKS
jgi:hypothetical protein